ncbi:MAG: 2-oxoglutarate dehydrogenase E1 component [Bacteriovoracaceae bacterium]|nr:2-oxoglutarate dehydrogenase E1 component [Bacteriovoracaceae bacterium]
MKTLDQSHVLSSDPTYIEEIYRKYKESPQDLDEGWGMFFRGMEFAWENHSPEEGAQVFAGGNLGSDGALDVHKEFKVFRLVQSYRARGHLLSKTNPIRSRKDRQPHLNLEDYGLQKEDLGRNFISGQYLGLGICTLQQIITHMEKIYCQSIGVEYMHIQNTDIRRWFRDKFESYKGEFSFSLDKKKRILEKLNQASIFENFLDTKYVGQKRFSLEGGENAIPALDSLISKSSALGCKEVVIGMAHRGRLNVLANILGKTYEYIFNEFEGQARPDLSYGDGDVKYHLGYSSEVQLPSGEKVYLKLMPNPSHLEAVGPVVLGYCRGQIDHLYEENQKQILPIIIHGDAAVAAQGIVYEMNQLSDLKGYRVGGTVHLVINNQIGFTTDFDDARTSTYCTSVARVLNVPAIHVNGDDAEAVVFAMELAAEFRNTFHQDVYVDMVCYRKHGHNESDEPRFTQPHMYELIKGHQTPREIYVSKLIQGKTIEMEMAQKMEETFRSQLQDRFNSVKQHPLPYFYQKPEKDWQQLKRPGIDDFDKSPDTKVSEGDLEKIYQSLITVPQDIIPITKAQKLLEERKKRWNTNSFDWSMGELFAYGSMVMEGSDVRLSGQDVIRGTFSHRHSKIFDIGGEKSHNFLNQLQKSVGAKGSFRVYNSPLSEYAVLGFEYGYSLTSPKHLVIWEAQFGDFANGAQTIFDQFISSGESKWQRMSGLVCLLPHGYEGQGPEHSNARPERFLQLAAEQNMIVANCTTPANYFHLLRRQLKWNFRKPLIVMTPKSLLRHPECVSSLDDFTKTSSFQELIYSPVKDTKKIKRVVFCTGKIYYDLAAYQKSNDVQNVMIVRLEQMYPLPQKKIEAILKDYAHAQFYWVQEEPKNMGAWTYLMRYSEFRDFSLISRKASASPATGYQSVHAEEQKNLVLSTFKA